MTSSVNFTVYSRLPCFYSRVLSLNSPLATYHHFFTNLTATVWLLLELPCFVWYNMFLHCQKPPLARLITARSKDCNEEILLQPWSFSFVLDNKAITASNTVRYWDHRRDYELWAVKVGTLPDVRETRHLQKLRQDTEQQLVNQRLLRRSFKLSETAQAIDLPSNSTVLLVLQ